ncbi:hypothetical protein K438DRAFT_2008759 [Mycena galopus ATCC 62051]|nr:hypothetical protein K438DRAFT_2008759 [Mycena galopus ATCC 62051]
MPISPVAIISFMTAGHQADTPGIGDVVRNRLEWTWGLGHNHLDEHLQAFADPEGVLMDNALLVMPHSDTIREIRSRNSRSKVGVRRPNIQKLYKGCTSFEYLVVPVDPASALPARMLVSQLPPHLALATTAGKVMEAWGYLTGDDYMAARASVVERSKPAIPPDSRFMFGMQDFEIIQQIYRTWSFIDRVPPSFLSEDSDQTMVEIEESVDSESDSSGSSGMKWEVESSASCYHEPERRLLPSELHDDFQIVNIGLYPSVDGEDDDAISLDSHVSGADDPDEFLQASIARDYEVNRSWLQKMKSWAEDISGADSDETLLNDMQIEEGPKEQPRVATSLDLCRPDYLSRKGRTAT